jgi:EamA domain-containing membrane protein RarD
MIVLAFICILSGYFGELPWLTAMVSFPWAAYGVSAHAYYRKSEKENTKNGIIYETAMLDYFPDSIQQNQCNINYNFNNNNDSSAVG